MVINRGIEDVFKGVMSSSADFLLTSNNTFFSRNIEQYGFDRSQFTGEFMKNERLNFDYIANYEGFGTTVEGLYYLETDCKECSEEWEHVFPQEIYDVSSMPVNRSFINVVINNPAINIMLISYLIISMIVYMFIKHHLILDRRRIAVNRLYGGHRGSITLMYLKSLLKIEFGSVVVAGLVLMPIMNPLFITEKVPGIGLISTLISLTILFITTSVSVYLNTKSGGGTAWK
ncbi:hypothetical protein AOC36_01190 [Erysipelothrix larvae]|uniref:Uncharacterized protein n=2 Tax=Erysipelothrix larvae TaxID=1514105 RepID=A0A120JTE6_9FIRM|nr:hypothetical protein AOC36_01190 [Erysipelothrix larvae]